MSRLFCIMDLDISDKEKIGEIVKKLAEDFEDEAQAVASYYFGITKELYPYYTENEFQQLIDILDTVKYKIKFGDMVYTNENSTISV